MDMPEAWQVRDYQRQQFFEALMQKIYELEELLNEKGSKPIFLELALIAVKYLKDKQEGKNIEIDPHLMGYFFETRILIDIKEFSRTPVEEDALVATFLKKVLDEALNPFHSELLHQQITNPELIYGASSRMAEMPFED